MNKREIKRFARLFFEGLESELAKSEVYEDEGGNQVQSVYLGSLINPSGKYYTPWANSNVDLCPRCKGEGCSFCGETGSREAYEDELFWEHMDSYADKIGAFVQAGEGDPCDTFICRVVESAE